MKRRKARGWMTSAGALLLLGFGLTADIRAMTIEVQGNSVFATGPVGEDYVKFKDAISQPGIERVVFVNSPGGDLWTGMQVGRLIKQRQLKTVAAGFCVSACSIMFMGGVERRFSDVFRPAQTYIGIHGPHDKYSKAVITPQGVQIFHFFKSMMGEQFNEDVMKMAFYDMEDAGSLLRVFDTGRQPKRTTYHCRSSKTLRKECTDIKDQDAISLGIVTTSDFAEVSLPEGFRKGPNIAGTSLNHPVADPDEFFKSLAAQQCSNDNCRKLIEGFPESKDNKALAIPMDGKGLGTVSNKDSETQAFLSAIYTCNHVKGRPARLCETQVVNHFDVRELYSSARASHAEALAKLRPPAEKHFANEEYDGGYAIADKPQAEDMNNVAPQALSGVKTLDTQALAIVLSENDAPNLINIASIDDVIPGSTTLLFGGFAYAEPEKETAYEARFSGLLKQLSPDVDKPIVFYSRGRTWHGANAALRAVKVGYKNVGWYRGGLDSWKAANLPLAKAVINAVVQ